MPTLARITIYPVKSLDPHHVEQATLLGSGALAGDRRFAIVDQHGAVLNGKRTATIHALRTWYDLPSDRLTVGAGGLGEAATFELAGQRGLAESWLSDFFRQPVALLEDAAQGFPDDRQSPGPTLISTATLETVAGWFGLSCDEARLRFRANLEIDGVEPFWEDRLVADLQEGGVPFRLGQAELLGTNPCQRCVVPTRHPHSGLVTDGFVKEFSRLRRESLPAWAPQGRFDHCYRLAVNTRPAANRVCLLAVGDKLVCPQP